VRGVMARVGFASGVRVGGRRWAALLRWVGFRLDDMGFGGWSRYLTTIDVSGLVGRVVTFSERDYQYGTGSLQLRVEHVDPTHPFVDRGERWYWVEGIQVSNSGMDLRPRTVLVRGRHLEGRELRGSHR
jgi:hypothetical protein